MRGVINILRFVFKKSYKIISNNALDKEIVENSGSVVGVERFELPTSCSQSRRATGLRYTPKGISLERVIIVSNS